MVRVDVLEGLASEPAADVRSCSRLDTPASAAVAQSEHHWSFLWVRCRKSCPKLKSSTMRMCSALRYRRCRSLASKSSPTVSYLYIPWTTQSTLLDPYVPLPRLPLSTAYLTREYSHWLPSRSLARELYHWASPIRFGRVNRFDSSCTQHTYDSGTIVSPRKDMLSVVYSLSCAFDEFEHVERNEQRTARECYSSSSASQCNIRTGKCHSCRVVPLVSYPCAHSLWPFEHSAYRSARRCARM